MKSKIPLFRFTMLFALIAITGSSVSCMTSYDSHGRPMQTVDPAVAIAGVAAAGLIGYAVSNDNGHHDHHYRRDYYGGDGYYYNDCY